MTSQTTSQFARPRIDARALLGLYDPADTTDWGPIRAAQLDAGRQLALFMLTANLIGAALITIILATEVPAWQLYSWGALVGAVAVAVTFRRLSSRHRGAVTASLREARSGVRFAPDYAELGFRCQVEAAPKLNGAPIDWESLVDRRAGRFLSAGLAYGHIAMEQALADSGLTEAEISNERTGIIVGSGGPSAVKTWITPPAALP